MVPTAIGPVLGFRYNQNLQAVSFKDQHINRCQGFLGPIADGRCVFIKFTKFDSLTGTLGYMARICEILFSLLMPFYVICQRWRGKVKNLKLSAHVKDLDRLRRHAKMIMPLIEKNYWVKFSWFLWDLPFANDVLYTDASTSFGAGSWCGNRAIQFAWEDVSSPLLPSDWDCRKTHINVLELLIIYVALSH